MASSQGCWGPRPLTRGLQVDAKYELYAPWFYHAGLCRAVESQGQALRQMDVEILLGGMCRERACGAPEALDEVMWVAGR